MCSRAARGIKQDARVTAVLRKQITALWPVVAIGLIRLALLSGIDYYVPTSEYGVHWNFFLTIACTSLISTAASFGAIMSAIAGCVLLITYQCFLSLAGGADYILTA